MAASVYKGLTIQIGADTTKLTTALRQATKSAEGTTKQLKQINSALKLDPNNVELLTKKQELLNKQIVASRDKLKVLKDAMSQLDENDISSEQWTQLATDITKTEANLKKYTDQLAETQRQQSVLKTGAFEVGENFETVGEKAKTAGEKIHGAGEKIQTFSGGVESLGGKMTAGITAPILAAGTAAITASIDIDSGLTSVRKTVDGTEEQYQQLKDAAIEFSKTNAVGADQMLEIDALGAQLGFAIEELELFGKVASGLDIATDMDAETASDQMAKFANITEMAHGDIERYGSSIVNLGNNLATTESAISAMAQRIGAAAHDIGLSQDEILGWSGAMSSLGINAEAGGSAFSTIISKIDAVVAKSGNIDKLSASQQKYVKIVEETQAKLNELNKIKLDVGKKGMSTDEWINLNNQISETKSTLSATKKSLGESDKEIGEVLGKLESFASLAGMSGEEFRKAWGEDASGALQDVLKGLDAADNKTIALEELEITELRQVAAMKALAGNTDLVSKALDAANKGWEENTALQNEVDNRNQSLAAKFEILKNKVAAVAEQVGKPLADSLLDAVDAAEPLIKIVEEGAEKFSNMSKEEQQGILKNIALVASLGPMLTILGKVGGATGTVVKGIGGATKAFGSFASGLGGVAKGATATSTAFSGLRGGLVGVGLAAGAAVLAFGISKWMEYQTQVEKVAISTKSLAELQDTAAQKVADSTAALDEAGKGYDNLKERIDFTTDSVDGLVDSNAKASDDFVQAWSNITIDDKKLETYIGIIDTLRDKSDLTAYQQERLKAAVEGYNEITGDSLGIIDLQNGKLDKSTEALDRNREAFIKNAKIKAYQDIIEERMKNQVEIEMNLADAEKEFEDAKKELQRVRNEEGFFSPNLAPATEAYQRAASNVSLLKRELQTTKDITAVAQDNISNLTNEIAISGHTFEDVKRVLGGFGATAQEAARNAGIDMDHLASVLELTGIGVDKLAAMTDEQFMKMVETCGNDTYKITEYLKGLQEVDIETAAKTLTMKETFQEFGNDTIKKLQDTKLNMDEFAAKLVEAGVSTEDLRNVGAENLCELAEDCKGNTDKMVSEIQKFNDKKYEPKHINLDGREVEDAVDWTNEILRNLGQLAGQVWSITVDFVKGAVDFFTGGNAAGGIVKNAAGGIKIPAHADGGILNRPTLTSVGWVGEDGAEAIIPLTNRKYVAPFARAVASEIGGIANNSTTYQFVLNGAVLNDDEAMREAGLNLLLEIQRRAGMNRG